MRKIAHEEGICKFSARRIARKEPNGKAYQLQNVPLLTDENQRVRLERWRQLSCCATGQHREWIVFTDEKLISVEQTHNRQNDRCWSAMATGTSAIVAKICSQFGAVCANGKIPLISVDGRGSQPRLLPTRYSKLLLPWAHQHFGDREWTFEQDAIPVHRAKTTRERCKTNFLGCISC